MADPKLVLARIAGAGKTRKLSKARKFHLAVAGSAALPLREKGSFGSSELAASGELAFAESARIEDARNDRGQGGRVDWRLLFVCGRDFFFYARVMSRISLAGWLSQSWFWRELQGAGKTRKPQKARYCRLAVIEAPPCRCGKKEVLRNGKNGKGGGKTAKGAKMDFWLGRSSIGYWGWAGY